MDILSPRPRGRSSVVQPSEDDDEEEALLDASSSVAAPDADADADAEPVAQMNLDMIRHILSVRTNQLVFIQALPGDQVWDCRCGESTVCTQNECRRYPE